MTLAALGIWTALLWIICGVGGAWYRALGMDRPHAAAICLFLLFAGGVMAVPVGTFELGVAHILITAALLIRVRDALEIMTAGLLALFAGVVAWLLTLTGWSPGEAGLLLAAPALPLAVFLRRKPQTAMLLLTLAPLMYGICAGFEHLYFFGSFAAELGVGAQYDAAIFALLAYTTASDLRRYGQTHLKEAKIRS